MKRFLAIFWVIVTSLFLLGGCVTTSGQQGGAMIGAAIGAGIPLVMEESSKVVAGGALIGAAAGAILGEVFSSPQRQGSGYAPAYSEVDSARARAYAETKQRIIQKRQREAVTAARKEGQMMAEEEMAEK